MTMSDIIHIPDTANMKKHIRTLSAGDVITLSGVVYTARDAAHRRMAELIEAAGPDALPFSPEGAVIYYAGPTPAPEGKMCGSFGPTTSGRMDVFALLLYDLGIAVTIGKGERSAQVTDAIVRNGGAYFAAIGGAGALAARHIIACEEIAFPELGCESIKKLMFDCFPLIVAIDTHGNDLYRRKGDCV